VGDTAFQARDDLLPPMFW